MTYNTKLQFEKYQKCLPFIRWFEIKIINPFPKDKIVKLLLIAFLWALSLNKGKIVRSNAQEKILTKLFYYFAATIKRCVFTDATLEIWIVEQNMILKYFRQIFE